MEIEKRSGTYAVVFRCTRFARIRIGRLGVLPLQPGYYVYVGSAFGPGGVRARIRHHMHGASRPHWHVDYLKAHCTIDEIWVGYSERKQESIWAGRLAECRQAAAAMRGFGASDRRDATHLYFFKERPSTGTLGALRPLRYPVDL